MELHPSGRKILTGDKNIYLTALHVFFQNTPDRRLENAEFFRHLHIEIQITVVDGFDLYGKSPDFIL